MARKQSEPLERVGVRRSAPARPTAISTRRGVPRVVERTLGQSDLIAVGVLSLVRDTIVAALAGAKDVGGELRGAAVAATRGAIKAAYLISGDLGSVAREAVRGTVGAAKQIGGDV